MECFPIHLSDDAEDNASYVCVCSVSAMQCCLEDLVVLVCVCLVEKQGTGERAIS